MYERDDRNMREYLELIEERMGRIGKNSLLIQKYNQDTELVINYSKEIEAAVAEIEKILRDTKDIYETHQGGKKEEQVKTTGGLVKKNILLGAMSGKATEELKRVLEELGATVFWVMTGEKALDAFQFSRSRTFDAILLDTHMPEKDGYLVAKAMRACNKENARWIPIIALLEKENAGDIRKSKDAGMNGWLSQPYEKREVENLLLRLVKNEKCV